MMEGVNAQARQNLLLKDMAEGPVAQVMACACNPISNVVSNPCHAWAWIRAPDISLPIAFKSLGLQSACLS